jgi:general secretion pathway protein F
MPVFSYRAVDLGQKAASGIVEAATPTAARAMLRDQGLRPVSVALSHHRTPTRAAKLSTKLLCQSTSQLATLLAGGVRIDEALQIVSRGARAPAAGLLLDVRAAVLEGRSFAAALAEHPSAFPEFYRACIAAGEQAGRLPQVMTHLADFVDRQERSRQKLQLAMIYPALLAGVSLLIIGFLLVYVMPSIVKVFVSHGADLPFLTRALIAVSTFFQTWGLALAAGLAGVTLLAKTWLGRAPNRLRLDRGLALAPLVGSGVRQISAARFCASLAMLVGSRTPLVEAMAAAAAVTPNLYVRSKVLQAASAVREGMSLHHALGQAAVFPPMLLAVVASGENGGDLATSLARAAIDLDRELETHTSAALALVEPVVVLVMGGAVLLLVLAILLPIVRLNSLAAA